MIKTEGEGVQGHSRSVSDNARAFLHIHEHQQRGLSFDSAVKATASAELASPSTIRKSYAEYYSTRTIIPHNTSYRGRGNPDHPNNTDKYGPSLETELLIHSLIDQQRTEGVSITATTIAAELRKRLQVDVTRRTVRRWLHSLGYEWQDKRYIGGMKPKAKNARIRQFILEYASALQEEMNGTAVVVYMDESFIYGHHSHKKGWFHPNNRDVIGDGDGKRLIILHAMTDNGLLAVPDEIASNWLNEPALTAELVFEEVLEDGQDESNYHNTINGAKFTAWIRNRLLPTFNKMYPGKKMFLVLDNASYHKPRDDSWISASKAMNKHELVHQLLDMGVSELTTVGKSPHIVPSHRFEAELGAGGPSKDDLLAAVQKWLDEHPDYNRTVIEQLFDDAGHALIYTPPFCPEVQPIELLWAKVKRYVADRSTLNRSIPETRRQTEEGFEQITKMFCNNIVKHCHDWIDSFVKTDAAEDLKQCGTLAGVIKSLPLLKLAMTTHQPSSIIASAISPPTAPTAAASATPPVRTLRKRH